MTPENKRRQTLLINWLAKRGAELDAVAQTTHSKYVVYRSGAVVSTIRISDHLTQIEDYINVILLPCEKNVCLIYNNFMWVGSFAECKNIIFALASTYTKNSKLVISRPEVLEDLKKTNVNYNHKCLCNYKSEMQVQICRWAEKYPKKICQLDGWVGQWSNHSAETKAEKWKSFLKKHGEL